MMGAKSQFGRMTKENDRIFQKSKIIMSKTKDWLMKVQYKDEILDKYNFNSKPHENNK